MTRQRPRLRIVTEGRYADIQARMQRIQYEGQIPWEEDDQAELDRDALDMYDYIGMQKAGRKADQQRQVTREWVVLAAVLFFPLICYLCFVLWRP